MDVVGEGGENGEKREWAELTQVCLVNVLSRLSYSERWKGTMLVCKSWFEASKDPSLFSRFDLDPLFKAVSDSSLWWSSEFENKIDSLLRSVSCWSEGGIKEIRVRHCSDRSLAFIAQRCPNLQVLSIKSCPNVTDMSITKVAFACSLLRELDISYCHEISYQSLEVIGLRCPNLKVLKRNLLNWLDPFQHIGIVPNEYLKACPQDGDREANVIATSMPILEHLELRFSKISAKGLASIADGCGSLEYLDLFGCANLTSRSMENASAKMKNLKTLVRPNFYIPRSIFHMERYEHWRLYDERFQTNALFHI